MQAFDRILGILLFLRGKSSVSAAELARRFGVSTRTIYRDLERLSALGVPLYAERGRQGGVKVLPGYFLPPLMFTQQEAIALLLGLTRQSSLRAVPFPEAREIAEKKLLAALPEHLRSLLTRAEQLVGFEKTPPDLLHPELEQPEAENSAARAPEEIDAQQSRTISIFFQALLDGHLVMMHYASPYREHARAILAQPLGLLWDRDRWYLAGKWAEQAERAPGLWRADRVLQITARPSPHPLEQSFDVRDLLGRSWLQAAMEHWRQRAPVTIRLLPAQAQRLQQDWYYRHAHFVPDPPAHVLMTFGEQDSAIVLELLRWLGPGAELLEPAAWRAKLREELQQMLVPYRESH